VSSFSVPIKYLHNLSTYIQLDITTLEIKFIYINNIFWSRW